MDNVLTGRLIRVLRTDAQMTQRQLAQKLGITEQAISKWERGFGSPDITLLSDLSDLFGVGIEKILAGELQPNERDRGNMKKIKFYVCPDCGGVTTATGGAEVSCCGRKLQPLVPSEVTQEHQLKIETVEDDYFITCPHEMTRAHYISFVAYVSMDKLFMVRLYPEQDAALRIPQMYRGTLYYYCTQHGLMQDQQLLQRARGK